MSIFRKETLIITFHSTKPGDTLLIHINGVEIRDILTPGQRKAYYLAPDDYAVDLKFGSRGYRRYVIVAPSMDPVQIHCTIKKRNEITMDQSLYSKIISQKRENEKHTSIVGFFFMFIWDHKEVVLGCLSIFLINIIVCVIVFFLQISFFLVGGTLDDIFGKKIKEGTTIETTVNTPTNAPVEEGEKEEGIVGDYISKTCIEAKEELESLGFANVVVAVESDSYKEGDNYDDYLVIRQNPNPGSAAPLDSRIRIFVKSASGIEAEQAQKEAEIQEETEEEKVLKEQKERASEFYETLKQKENMGFEECWKASEYEERGKILFPETYILLNKSDNLVLIVDSEYRFYVTETADDYEHWRYYLEDGKKSKEVEFREESNGKSYIFQELPHKVGRLKGNYYHEMPKETLEELIEKVVTRLDSKDDKSLYFKNVLETKDRIENRE